MNYRVNLANADDAHIGWTPALGGFETIRGSVFRTRIPTHLHSQYVIGVVDAGSVLITVRDRSYLATAGSVVVFAPYEAHAELASPETGWSFRYLYPSEASVRAALGADGGADSVSLRLAHPVIDDERVATALGRTFDSLTTGADREHDECRLAELFGTLRARHYAPLDPAIRRSKTRLRVREVRRLLVEQPQKRVTLEGLARSANLSPYHFNRVFREEVGLPPYSYFEQLRIARAQDMIRAGLPLCSVAFGLGFSDQAHFTRHYRRASVLTPGQYARLARRFADEREIDAS